MRRSWMPSFVRAMSALAYAACVLVAAGVADEASPQPHTFSEPIPGINTAVLARFNYGRGLFHHLWPSITHADGRVSGLGPLFNARGCAECHVRDGRGRPPQAGDPHAVSLVLVLSTAPRLEDGQWVADPDPVYGAQLQDQAIGGVAPEGAILVTYSEQIVSLNGGEQVGLRVPRYEVKELAYGPFGPNLRLGPRLAPPVFGLGFIEAIPEEAILANADEADTDADGISGKANLVVDEASGTLRIGRFGWKATAPSVRQQSDHAATLDMGLSSPLLDRPAGDCTADQHACNAAVLAAPPGKDHELGPEDSVMVAFYVEHLAIPPARRQDEPAVAAGRELFDDIGCSACHVATFTTSADESRPYLASQEVWPYSDFLLHDMGEALADEIATGMAGPSEWRTPPLWGIGLTEAVGGHTNFLHDGRARNLTEAILWHGGEASAAREAFRALTPEMRQSVLAFLDAL